MRHRLRYLAAVVLCGLAVSLLPAPAPAGAHPSTQNRADAAAGWLARQMVAGDHFEVEFGGVIFPDQGLTIDAVFGFAAAGVSDAFAARATVWLARPEILSGYVGDGVGESYAGAHAKVLLAAEVRGVDPSSFGGVDLPARLRGLQAPSGRFSDRSAFGDFSNAFSQSLAVIALERTAAGVPAVAVDFLAGSQCPDGGFPLTFGQPTCASDVDATAMVVQALLATDRTGDAGEGLTWLVGRQQPGGGFAAVAGGSPNANSTGLAGQALRVGGRHLAALRAKVFLIGLQVGCAGPAADRGAVAFDATGFDPATAPRATAQAILGLAGVGLADLDATGARPAAPVLACLPHTATGLVVAEASPPAAHAAACSGSTGVTVVVDFASLSGGVQVGCAVGDPASGLATLTGAGFSYAFVPRFPGFICRINSLPNPCNGAPATAYWSYWHAPHGGTWSYSTLGAAGYNPAPGAVEGWAFGAGNAPGISPP